MMEPEDVGDSGVDPKNMGLFAKYDVTNKRTGEPVTEPVFVLKPESDPLSRVALRHYAVAAFQEGYENLAQDIYNWLEKLEAKELEKKRIERDKLSNLEKMTEKLDTFGEDPISEEEIAESKRRRLRESGGPIDWE